MSTEELLHSVTTTDTDCEKCELPFVVELWATGPAVKAKQLVKVKAHCPAATGPGAHNHPTGDAAEDLLKRFRTQQWQWRDTGRAPVSG